MTIEEKAVNLNHVFINLMVGHKQLVTKLQASETQSNIIRLGWVDCIPLLLAVGVLMYQWLPREPYVWESLWVIIVGLLALRCRKYTKITLLLLMILGILTAMVFASWQTERMQSNPFPKRSYPYTITGTVQEVILEEKRLKLLIDVLSIETLSPEQTPRRIRISMRGQKQKPIIGEQLRFKAVLYQPSPPVMPGSFNFARYFYYRGIDAVGYILPPYERLDISNNQENFTHHFAELRLSLQRWLMTSIPAPMNGIAIALLIGDKTAISDEIKEAFRDSSLAHILAISGMHMGIVCGLLFLLLRIILSFISPIALRFPVKKIAAIVALMFGGFYLLLANFPISAIRAYIMVAVFFGGVLLDREALTIRSLSLAAIIILLWMPSSLVEPGFQMSFAATFALIVAYRYVAHYRKQSIHGPNFSAIRKILLYFLGIMGASLVASWATMPYIMFHFNQLAPYGVLANLLALPLLSFWVMPTLLLALFLWPFGIEAWAIQLASLGIEYMVAIAQWVANIPGAVWYIPPLAPAALLIITIGMFLLLLAPRWWKLTGIACYLLGLASASLYLAPDLLISNDGKHVALKIAPKEWIIIRGKSNRNFIIEQWQERLGVEMQLYKHWQKQQEGILPLTCDQTMCEWNHHNNILNISRSEYDSILIGNQEILVSDLQTKGAHAIWLQNGKAIIQTSCDPEKRRPYTGCHH